MLAPNLLLKLVPHSGSRLLLGLIVRIHRRVVEGLPPPECASQARPSRPPFRERGPYLGDPRPVARFRSERYFWRFAWAYLRPYFPMLCSQGQLNRRMRALVPELRELQLAFALELAEPSAV